MRIGTWNLDARWGPQQLERLAAQECDVWLLTEVQDGPDFRAGKMGSYFAHQSAAAMSRGQFYSMVLSRHALTPLPCQHGAAAIASDGNFVFCASVLPWAGCTRQPCGVWVGESLADMTHNAISRTVKAQGKGRLVWGGDWNQNLAGGWQHVGSRGMRTRINQALQDLDLQLPTAALGHQFAKSFTIDHIAVPKNWNVISASQVDASDLSDHDVYVVEVDPVD